MKEIIKMYLDYVNNFISTERFAEYYEVDEEDAIAIINIGRKYRERRIELDKMNYKP